MKRLALALLVVPAFLAAQEMKIETTPDPPPGKVRGIDKETNQILVEFAAGTEIGVGSVLTLPAEGDEAPCQMEVLDTYRTNRRLAKFRETVVLAELVKCPREKVKDGQRVAILTMTPESETERPTRDEAAHELVTSVTGATVSFRGSSTSVGVAAGYHHAFQKYFQVGIVSGWSQRNEGANKTSNVQLLVGPTVNLLVEDDWRTAFFARLAIGFNFNSVEQPIPASSTRFAGTFEIGKRFVVMGNLLYRPSVVVYKEEAVEAALVVTPLQFSAAF